MFVQIEETPNPRTLRFLPECKVLDEGSINFTSSTQAKSSPLAKELFAIKDVTGVLIGSDFIAVTIQDDENWVLNKPKIIAKIVDFFARGEEVVQKIPSKEKDNEKEYSKEEQIIVNKIKQLIEEQVRPAVAMDGGDIVFSDYIEGTVYLEMQGACQGCPISGVTLKNGVENLLKYYIPEVKEVVSISE